MVMQKIFKQLPVHQRLNRDFGSWEVITADGWIELPTGV